MRLAESFVAGQQRTFTRITIIVGGGVSIGVLHQITPHSSLLWHNIFQWLYYLPVVYAATNFGLWGGLGAATLAGLGYIPHFLEAAEHSPNLIPVEFAEVAVLFLVSGVAGMLADLEHKQRDELQKTTAKLKRVHQELQASFEHLRRVDRMAAIGQLSARLAHEIRNPLASIRGAVDVLGQPQTTDEVRREFRAIIQKECGRLEHLLAELLDFARPRPPEYRETDVSQKLESVVALLARAAAKNRITLRQNVSMGLPSVECDPEQIRQVILNLALNAIQAMREGGEVVLSGRLDGAHVLIEIQDQGHGIASEDLDKVFEPFYTTKENGTGLGLPVVREIVAQHQGTISARRNEGKGMTFSLRLPLHQGKAT
jgi:signal transduction histidine kinase